MALTLQKLPNYDGVKGPLVFVIMDGVGIFKGSKEGYPGNAYEAANPQTLHALIDNEKISTRLQAHGTAVGMPSDADQGNSEVGHNAMGAGRVFDQGASLVAKAIAEKKIYQGEGWKRIIGNALDNKAPIHFIGLLSDGNVHSNIAPCPFASTYTMWLFLCHIIQYGAQKVKRLLKRPAYSARKP